MKRSVASSLAPGRIRVAIDFAILNRAAMLASHRVCLVYGGTAPRRVYTTCQRAKRRRLHGNTGFGTVCHPRPAASPGGRGEPCPHGTRARRRHGGSGPPPAPRVGTPPPCDLIAVNARKGTHLRRSLRSLQLTFRVRTLVVVDFLDCNFVIFLRTHFVYVFGVGFTLSRKVTFTNVEHY